MAATTNACVSTSLTKERKRAVTKLMEPANSNANTLALYTSINLDETYTPLLLLW